VTTTAHTFYSKIIQSLTLRGFNSCSCQIFYFTCFGFTFLLLVLFYLFKVRLILARDWITATEAKNRNNHFTLFALFVFQFVFYVKRIRMTPDFGLALVSSTFLALFVMFPALAEPFFDFYLTIGREVTTLALLSLVAFAYYSGYLYTTLATSLLVVYLLYQTWVVYRSSDKRRLNQEVSKDNARFDPLTSIDLQFANGTAVHDSPNMLAKDKDHSPLIVFPPTKEAQHQLNG